LKPTVALAFGSVFNALEIVPLLLVGHEKAKPNAKEF
jgi:hypothetical protein